MLAAEKIEIEIAKIDAILARRGGLYEDEKVKWDAFKQAAQWLKEDKEEEDRIELEARLAEEYAAEEAKKNDPNYKTREMFRGVKIKVPGKGQR